MHTIENYPSVEHFQAAQVVAAFFSGQEVDAVILTGSCARKGKQRQLSGYFDSHFSR